MTPDQRAELADKMIGVLLEEAANLWPHITIEGARAIFNGIQSKRNGNLALYLRARFIALIEQAESESVRRGGLNFSTNPAARSLPPPHLCGGNNCEECGMPGVALHARTCSCQE